MTYIKAVFNWFIRLFSSVRFALWIILLLAIVSLAGTVLRQSFFDVFHSPIFIVLGSLLILAIAVCSLKRMPSLIRTSRGTSVESAARLLEKGNATRSPSKISAPENIATVTGFLSHRGYRVRQQEISGATVFVADKNRFAPWGTYAIHLSLILLTAGYLIGSAKGYTNDFFVVSEGETKAIGAPYDGSIKLVDFQVDFYDNNEPKDYRSQVQIIVDNQTVKEGTVRVNYPFSYGRLSIYQASYGPAVPLQISDAAGTQVFNGSVALTDPISVDGIIRYAGSVDLTHLTSNGAFIFLINSAGPGDPVVPDGKVRVEFYDASPDAGGNYIDTQDISIGSTDEFHGLKFTAGTLTQYSVFQLREDPGLNLIWAAFILFMLGLVTVFYFPHRQMVIAVYPDVKGSRIAYHILGKKNQAGADEIEAFAKAIGASGQIQPKNSERKLNT